MLECYPVAVVIIEYIITLLSLVAATTILHRTHPTIVNHDGRHQSINDDIDLISILYGLVGGIFHRGGRYHFGLDLRRHYHHHRNYYERNVYDELKHIMNRDIQTKSKSRQRTKTDPVSKGRYMNAKLNIIVSRLLPTPPHLHYHTALTHPLDECLP